MDTKEKAQTFNIIVVALTVLFFVFKILGAIQWSWLWVLSPLWIAMILWIALAAFVLITSLFIDF